MGEAQGNYDELRLFTGLRPSEQIALLVSDCDVGQGKIRVTKARVVARDKDRTKTSEDRLVDLCPRALEVLKRQLALRAKFKLAGKIKHEELFFKDDGAPIRNLQYPGIRWRKTLTGTLKGRYRKPYNARHSSVTRNLMIGNNPLWVAKQHGHSVQTMLETYAAWLDGTTESDLRAIRAAMEGSYTGPLPAVKRPSLMPSLATGAVTTHWNELLLATSSPRAVTRLSLAKRPKSEVPVPPRNRLAERESMKPPSAEFRRSP